MKTLRILGIRGIPAAHGGFETFAEALALHLVRQGWRVVVYCQEEDRGPVVEDAWQGIERVCIPVEQSGPFGTIVFDWRAIRHAAQQRDLCLTLGYNTAAFCARLRLQGIPNLINMDGIEWSRAKWGLPAKIWLWLNDWAGCWLGNHLVADHPEIARHLATRVAAAKITTIPYGADAVIDAPSEPVSRLGLEPGRYLTLIARAEPENSILEIVTAFSRKRRDCLLAVLGHYDEGNPYHRAVRQAASDEVKFLGAIYDKETVRALRCHSLACLHGHQVGGTNPSLVEALGAGNAVLAHDNRFNRWVAGPAARYFNSTAECARQLDEMLSDPQALGAMQAGSRQRFAEAFTWPRVLDEYERLLTRHLPQDHPSSESAR